MSDAALADGRAPGGDALADASRRMILRALDPTHSVVVEACAGSGKTWLLAARIVRLLLAGVAPGEILAITFTRKAAREIEERVVGWLRLLATGGDAELVAFLAERGVRADDPAVLRTARGLYERVLAAQPRLAVNTFHGWFLQLVAAAPLSANLAGATLVDTGSRLFDELWQSFAARLRKAPHAEATGLTQAFVRLLADPGLEATRRLLRRALDRRSEWLAFAEGEANVAAKVVAALRVELGRAAPNAGACTAINDFFADGWGLDFEAYLGCLEMSPLQGDQEAAATLRAALAEPDCARAFAGLRTVLLTKDNALRAKNPGPTLDRRYTPAGASRFLELHARLGERLIDCLERQTAERIAAFNEDACAVFAAFLAHVEEFKSARRQIDFVDAEWSVLQLLRDEQTAAFVQARLDARYKHVLIDEFQDTNPLQWQILLAWFEAYSDAARPTVFLVGDPKQAIYRFRRAEPRLFAVAAEFLEREFGAVRCAQDATRRNAQAITDVVNALFLEHPEFTPFRAQASFMGALPGRVELLPLCGHADDAVVPASDGIEGGSGAWRDALRDPLREPDVEAEDLRLTTEAQCLATKMQDMLGANGAPWQIEERIGGVPRLRPLRYGDFMLLVRTRTHLAAYERALSAVNIPFDAGSRGGLLGALEVRDAIAVLEFLVTPNADLKLAHALRSPIFACTDEDLLRLAARPEHSWWQRLQALTGPAATAGSLTVPPSLRRAARLLADWLVAADRLPAHDLLDRIFDQGEIIARYRLAVPHVLQARVEANLRALLLFALDLDGGRYPSLPRFIDELRDLRDADAGDAPDEGVIDAPSADAGRVRILTIHGAKGLEAPVVWLLGANATPRPPDPWDVVVDWPPQARVPRHFSFYGRKEDRGRARQPLFAAEAAAARREELNLLYVALTRARQVFIASGIASSRERSAERGATPYRLLAAAIEKLGGATAYGDLLPVRAVHAENRSPIAAPVPVRPLPAVGERRPVASSGERFGTLLHALLERRTGGVTPPGWWKSLGFTDVDYRRVVPVAERLLTAPHLQRFFDPAHYRRAWNEIDLTRGDGQLQRIDRLVDFAPSAQPDNAMWVLDYKSSHADTARLDEYRVQVGEYCQAVTAIFPDRLVRGAIVFADASLLEVC